MKQNVKRLVEITLVTKPGFCPNRIVGKDNVARCWKTIGMEVCPSFNEFTEWCPLEDAE